MKESPPNEPSLEGRLARLDNIARQLDSGDLELDEALGLFEEAIAHIRDASAQLQAAELRVEEVVGRADEPELRSLDLEGE